MTGYINWKALTMPIKGDALQMEGNNVADAVTVASGGTSAVAPEGAHYASVWCDVDSTIEANIIGVTNKDSGDTIYNAKEIKVPASSMVQIPNVIVGQTTITITDI